MRDRRRAEFPSLGRWIHLLSHSLGPMPRAARDSMSRYLQLWEDYGAQNAWKAEWWDLTGRVGDLLARLLGGTPGSVQVQPNASVAHSAVASCFDFGSGRRRKIVTTALEFPTTEYVWREQDTALVVVSHASYRSSFLLDPQPVAERAHAVGSLLLLDVYQTAGVLPLCVADWGVDFAVGGTIKWLCGGPACGYLYVRPDLLPRLEPRLTGWIAHESPFDFAPGRIRYDRTVRRFAQGTPGVPALYSCLPGLELILGVGLPAIAEESQRRTRRIVETALDRGWHLKSPAEDECRGGSVMLGAAEPERLEQELARRGVLVDWRPGVLRISPHFFNTDDELEQALKVLSELLA
jgi:kynureninase